MDYRNIAGQDELKHYGVLGMKWGIRRARKKGTTYSYKSHGTKKYERKTANAKTAADKQKWNRRAQRSRALDARMEANVRKSSGLKVAGKMFVNGPFYSKTYELAKATFDPKNDPNQNRLMSEGMVMAAAILGVGSIPLNAGMRAAYVRQGEKEAFKK